MLLEFDDLLNNRFIGFLQSNLFLLIGFSLLSASFSGTIHIEKAIILQERKHERRQQMLLVNKAHRLQSLHQPNKLYYNDTQSMEAGR